MAASAASRELFTDGVRAVLHSWPVLQIAVENGFGGAFGPQKADWMVDVVQQYFHDNANLQQYEVEDYLAVLLDQEFDTVVDDGSLPQVSLNLLQMYAHWQQGALESLKTSIQALSQKKTQRAKVQAPPISSDEDSDAETQEMECGESQQSSTCTHPPPPPQEEDGWTVVRRKK
ncbi:pre-rRNA-processing protein TSR2 homolog [Oryzias melastigma]|uniref:Pre-rRNA-processing protein TSR2 homolog n=1 Tax=Oryzias melastigma TaxID=30732 RepID=A0A3B3DFZ6_ORYME|nr:pre-rRNA-processing protein TSR2 homolog [Oryzias melastigma]